MENKIPNGWTACPLKDVVSSRKGKKPNAVIDHAKKGYDPYILIDELEGNSPRTYTNDTKVPRATEKDVLLVWDGSIGKCASGLSGAVGSTIAVLSPKNGLNTKYLEYFIKRNKNYITETSTGSGLQHVNKSLLKTLEIPLPPDGGQKRIADKLDVLLTKVKDAQSHLDKIPLTLKRFRQSVLSSACSGHLTADWQKGKPDVGPYPLERRLDKEYEHIGEEFPVSWRVAQLGDLTTLVTSGSRGWAKYYSDIGSIFIRAQNINSDVLNLDDIAFVKLPKHAEGLRTKVQQHDILVTITGANVTKSALVERVLEDAYVSQHVALVRLADVRISRCIYYSIISLAHGRKQLQAAAYGQGKPGLNLDNIRDVIVGLPPLAEQKEIVTRVETLFALADKIEARYNKAKVQVDKLEQSILAKAFRGELVS